MSSFIPRAEKIKKKKKYNSLKKINLQRQEIFSQAPMKACFLCTCNWRESEQWGWMDGDEMIIITPDDTFSISLPTCHISCSLDSVSTVSLAALGGILGWGQGQQEEMDD